MKPNLNSDVGPRRKKDHKSVLKKAKMINSIQNFLRLERDLDRIEKKKTITNIMERYNGWLNTIAQMKRRINPTIFVTGCR
jgi:hypothetical protein